MVIVFFQQNILSTFNSLCPSCLTARAILASFLIVAIVLMRFLWAFSLTSLNSSIPIFKRVGSSFHNLPSSLFWNLSSTSCWNNSYILSVLDEINVANLIYLYGEIDSFVSIKALAWVENPFAFWTICSFKPLFLFLPARHWWTLPKTLYSPLAFLLAEGLEKQPFVRPFQLLQISLLACRNA